MPGDSCDCCGRPFKDIGIPEVDALAELAGKTITRVSFMEDHALLLHCTDGTDGTELQVAGGLKPKISYVVIDGKNAPPFRAVTLNATFIRRERVAYQVNREAS